MLFQTPEFLVLLGVVLAAVAALRSARWQHAVLLAASYLFYGWWDVRFVLLLLLSSLVDYSMAWSLGGNKLSVGRRLQMTAWGVLGTLICLGVNWPALQGGAAGALLAPGWTGARAALAISLSFCLAAPLAYELYFLLPVAARRRALLTTSLVLNLGLLAFFKYCNFFLDSVAGIGATLGSSWQPSLLQVALPVGISFYTFQTLSYTIDCYRGTLQPERSLLRVALYVAYFPQLVAGPIMRPREFLPSLNAPWKLSAERVWSGFHLAMTGLMKKVLIADSVAVLSDAILDDPFGRPGAAIMLGSLLFAVQIYCDFSGYTDIARGVSRVLGVEIPLNFRAPYFSTSIIDFWRRWHISLSSWLRDYLYVPLGGSRGSRGRTHVNLLATMVLGGLWHGAAWNFVIWGAYQGVLLSINRELREWIQARPRLDHWLQTRPGTVLRWAATMYCVLLGWLIFRITDPAALAYAAHAYVFAGGGGSLSGIGLGNGLTMLSLLALAVFLVLHTAGQLRPQWPQQLDSASPRLLAGAYVLLGMLLFFAWPGKEAPFVYFQF